jgi:hypothetical protein
VLKTKPRACKGITNNEYDTNHKWKGQSEVVLPISLAFDALSLADTTHIYRISLAAPSLLSPC